jgi:RNA polymerase sigma-70 factor (ECF subfamily)
MPPTSATLLERLQDHRDNAAWERLVALYTPLIRGWLGRHLPACADLDELAQQVFSVLVEKIPDFRHSGRAGAFRAWLRGICVNRVRKHWRSRPAGHGPDPEPALAQLEDPGSELSRRWDREHDEHVARKLLELLRPEFQPGTWRAFERLMLEGGKPDEVAAELGLSVNAVFIAKSRVLRRLREEAEGLID